MNTTPSKRRKISHPVKSPSTVRSLDFFFNKQQAKASSAQEPSPHRPSLEDATRLDQASTALPLLQEDESGQMTDEELARKLQAEWDQEERANTSQSIRTVDVDHTSTDAGSQKHPVPARHSLTPERDVGIHAATQNVAPVQSPDANAPKSNTLSLQSTAADEDTISYSIPFDESPLTFDPQKYIPSLHRQWQASSGSSTYAILTHCFILVNSTTSRIKIVDTLTNLLRTLIESDPTSLLPAVWLATNSISPPYIDIELGLGGSAISKAMKQVSGLDNASLKALFNKHGDAGDVAYEAKKRQSFTLRKPRPLTIRFVFDSLMKIALAKGHGSVEVKQRIVERMVQDARGAEESRYIVRTLVQHLRIGAVKTTMLIALSRAFLLSCPPGASFVVRDPAALRKLSKADLADVYKPGEELIKASFARRPNYNDLVPALLDLGVLDHAAFMARVGLALHIPLRPMLGGITRDLNEMLVRLEGREFTCEYKYDGQRAQVHCDAAGKVTIFSRHLEVMTSKYPDLVALVPAIRGDGVRSFILEGEVVAVDRATGALKPFQILANRARKDVGIHEVKVDVCLFAFDLMYLNGEELLHRSFRERRSLLRSLFTEIPGHFTWVHSLDATSDDVDAISAFFKAATEIKCEGIMAKLLDDLPSAPATAAGPLAPLLPLEESKELPPAVPTSSAAKLAGPSSSSSRRKALPSTYTPDKRMDSWLKVKKDYNNAQTETLDMVPVAGWHGQGRKNKWWSPVLMAVRNEDDGTLEVVTKCYAGFTDAFYKEMRAKYDPPSSGSTATVASDSDNDDDGSDDDDEAERPLPTSPPAGESPTQRQQQYNVVSRPSYITYSGPEPDVWFHPQEVWEILFADITLSPLYSAARGLVNEERGLSLRFPRFLKTREDKGIEEASTNYFLAELYRKQELKVADATAGEGGAGAGGGNGKGVGGGGGEEEVSEEE